MATRKKKSRQMKAAIAEMTATTAKTAKTRMREDTPASNHTVYIYIYPDEEITSQYLHEIIHAHIYLWINTNSA